MKDVIGNSEIELTNLPRKRTFNKVYLYNKPQKTRYC